MIPHEDKNRWFYLAAALARDHVPAFKIAGQAGRPRKQRNALRDLSLFGKQKKMGRPPTRDGYRKAVLKCVEKMKAEHGLSGRGADKKALEMWFTDTPSKITYRLRKRLQLIFRTLKNAFPKRKRIIPKSQNNPRLAFSFF